MAQDEEDALATRQLESSNSQLSLPTLPRRRAPLPEGAASARVGRYVLLHEIGRGSMGVVHAAYDDTLDRKVALKFISHASASSAEARARLVREAQAMARLSHANVVHIYEADADDTGRIYIAMEFVDGTTLRKWIRSESRTWADVVAMFVQVGEGLAAAHEAGVVHRDFKPANVLVDTRGQPKVADFGLAGLDGSSLESAGLSEISAASPTLTQTGTLMGTPAYMAPEQHRGDASDARSDQFAFCVALYEALYGQRPFRSSEGKDLAAVVLEGRVPPAPKGVAVPGWVRSIAVRGLRLDPGERYPSMTELVRALRADPGARRRRWLLAVAGVAVLGLAVASTTSSSTTSAPEPCSDGPQQVAQMWNSEVRDQVRTGLAAVGSPIAEDTAERVVVAFDAYAEAWREGYEDACRATRVVGSQSEAMLDKRMACLQRRRIAASALARVLAEADAEVLRKAVSATADLPAFEPCADASILAAEVPPPQTETQRERVDALLEELAEVEALLAAGRVEASHRAATEIAEQADEIGYAPLIAEARTVLAQSQVYSGELDASVASLRIAYAAAERGKDDRRRMLVALRLLYVEATRRGKLDAAEAWSDVATATNARIATTKLEDARLAHEIGVMRDAQGRFDDALASYERAQNLLREAEGDQRVELASIHNDIGVTLGALRRFEEGVVQARRAITLWEHVLGSHHPGMANAHNNLGAALFRVGKIDEASAELRRALDIRVENFGEMHRDVGRSRINLGALHIQKEEYQAAETELREARRVLQQTAPEDEVALASVTMNLGTVLTEQGDHAAALPMFDEALEVRLEEQGRDHVDVADVHVNRGTALADLDRREEAIAAFREALRIRAAALGEDHVKTEQVREYLAELDGSSKAPKGEP